MQANWSIILNVLLLIGVFVAIGRMIKTKREQSRPLVMQPSLGQVEPSAHAHEDIISVRKIKREVEEETTAEVPISAAVSEHMPTLRPQVAVRVSPEPKIEIDPIAPCIEEAPVIRVVEEKPPVVQAVNKAPKMLMMFLLAKDNRQFSGYELLQTVLASGLRYGEGQLFHRHQLPNGQGPVLCSLAAATQTGVFDLQNIGAFSVRGLCLYMQSSGNSGIDEERLGIMIDTAKQLSEGLDAHLLDDRRQPLSDAGLQRYYQQLNINESCEQMAQA